MYGDLVVMIEVAAFMMTIGVFASVAIGATASASGVKPKPARKSTLSRNTRSSARRLAISGDGPVVSLTMSSIFRPATVSPCCFMYVLMPAVISPPMLANGPDVGTITPTLTGSGAAASAAVASAVAASAHARLRNDPDPVMSASFGTSKQVYPLAKAAGITRSLVSS